MFCNITYVAPKGGFTETRESLFFTEEAAVDDLVAAHFYDKMLIIKELFEIGKGLKKALKGGKLRKSKKMLKCAFGGFKIIKRWPTCVRRTRGIAVRIVQEVCSQLAATISPFRGIL